VNSRTRVWMTVAVLAVTLVLAPSGMALGQQATAQLRQATTVQDTSTSSVAKRLTEELRSLYGDGSVKKVQEARNRNEVIDILKGYPRSTLAQELVKGAQKSRRPAEFGLSTNPSGIDPCWLVCLNCVGIHCEPPPGCSSLTSP